jgi:hypothetical protein
MKTSWLAVFALVGCASTPDTPHLDFFTDTYTLQPGDEKYFCYTTNLPADREIAIIRLTPTYGAGTHHILFSQAVAPEPVGFSECPVLSKTTWVPMYAGGKGSDPLELPANTGFKPFTTGQQVIMQLHLQNTTDAPISGRAAMRMEYVDATPDLRQAGVFALDNRKLDIPAHTAAALNEMSCVVGEDLHVFAALGHMHKHGVHLDLSRGAVAGSEMLYEEDWNFDAQPIAPLPLELKKGDNLFLRCTHNNDGVDPLPYGESSNTEMCILLMYYAPIEMVRSCVNK